MNKKIIFSILLLTLVLSISIVIGFNITKPKSETSTEPESNNNNNIVNNIPDSILPPVDNTKETYIINNGKNATEYNGKIYYNNHSINNPYSNITICEVDLNGENKKTLLPNDITYNVNIYNNTIYTPTKKFNLSQNEAILNALPITYIDEKITIYTNELNSINHVFDTSNNSYETGRKLLSFDGIFIERIDNTIYFYKNGTTRNYLYSGDLTTGQIVCIDDTKFEKIFEDYYDEYSEYTFQITDIEYLNDTIVYCIGCYQGSGNFWYGNVIKINSNGSNKTFLEIGSDVNSLSKDSVYIYYGKQAYSTISNTTTNKTLLAPDEYTVENINNELYLMKLSSNNKTYSKFLKITNNYENFSSVYDIVDFNDYLIVYLEYRNYNEGGWRGIPSMYIYHIKKDGSKITLLNGNQQKST